MSHELKPCPFCGSEAAATGDDDLSFCHIVCDSPSCPASNFSVFCTIDDWNNRQSPWISVDDRLPEEGQYLCLLGDESPFGNVCLSRYTTKVVPNWEAERHRHSLITHWMPLPEPPKA